MSHDDCSLRAIVTERDGGFEARLLEFEIAVRADSVDHLLREIEHALVVTYEIAHDLGETPFISVLSRRANTDRSWQEDRAKVDYIELPDEVSEALAAVLRYLKPIRKIAVLQKAA